MILTTRLTQIVPERSITKVKWGVQSFTDIKARGSAMRVGSLAVAVPVLNVYNNKIIQLYRARQSYQISWFQNRKLTML